MRKSIINAIKNAGDRLQSSGDKYRGKRFDIEYISGGARGIGYYVYDKKTNQSYTVEYNAVTGRYTIEPGFYL